MAHVRIVAPFARLCTGLFALLLAAPLFADSQARIVRLSDVEGNVQIDRRTGEGFESALENLPVLQGTRIATKGDGRAEIEFEDGSTIRLAPNTTIEFTRLSLHDSGGKHTELEVTEGTAYFNINPGRRDDFTVDVGRRSINLEHETRFRITVDQSRAQIAVRHGQVDLPAQGSETVSISKGRTASFDLLNPDNQQNAYNVVHEYDEGPYDEWNQNLDNYHSRNFHHASSETPYAYGFSDLNYYGSYISDPSFGSCWRPYFASYSWDPFADGTWVWYPGNGYTWVSSYPWGWAPYRYGSWNFAQTSGWCWQPGAWNQWVSVPTIARPRPGYKFPPPPADGHGRVARIHGGVLASDGGSRFGDPSRRLMREGPDGRNIALNAGARSEAGLGVPRGHVNLRNLPNSQAPEWRGYIGDQRGGERNAGRSSSAPSQQGRSSSPAPAPRPQPAPRMSPPPSPPPAPRGGKGL